MALLARKMSVITAIFALIVVIVTGFISGGAVDVVIMRGGLIFFMIMGGSMLLFNLALKDRPGSPVRNESEEGNDR